MSNSGVLFAGVSLIAAELQRHQIDPRQLKFYRSRIEPTDPGELQALNERRVNLARSWLEKPIHEIYVRDGDFAIAEGNERVAGLLLLGIESITVVLLPDDTPDAELDRFSVLTDVHKSKLRPAELAAVLHRYIESTGAKKGEAAATFRVDNGFLTKLLSLFSCPQEAIDHAMQGRLAVEDWYSISKSPQPLETLRLVLGGANRKAVQQSAKPKAADSGKPPEKNDRLLIPMGYSVVLVKARKGENPLELAGVRQLLADALAKVEEAIGHNYGIKTAARSFADTKDRAVKARKLGRKKKSD